jgi:hypothetical protein
MNTNVLKSLKDEWHMFWCRFLLKNTHVHFIMWKLEIETGAESDIAVIKCWFVLPASMRNKKIFHLFFTDHTMVDFDLFERKVLELYDEVLLSRL